MIALAPFFFYFLMFSGFVFFTPYLVPVTIGIVMLVSGLRKSRARLAT